MSARGKDKATQWRQRVAIIATVLVVITAVALGAMSI